MNPIAEEIKFILSLTDPDTLAHYGVKRRSGRYPWGSGKEPYQHSGDFLARVEELRAKDFKYVDPETGKEYSGDIAIAKSMDLTTTELRTQISLASNERRAVLAARARDLRDKGYSLNEIARQMGYNNDSSVRSLLNEGSKERMLEAEKTAHALKELIDTKGMIDVGAGVEQQLNISKERLNQALYILEREGYPVYGAGVPQVTNPGKQTNVKVICPPGTPYKEVYNFDKIHSVDDYISRDGGETLERAFRYPASMDSKRLAINYAEDGGIEKDGLIELRRGVPDLSLGESHYSQVRILVDGTHYLKGMAVYSDDLPDGVDIRFNTNKKRGTPALGEDKNDTVLKKIKNDPDNPFGSYIKEHGGQSYYIDPVTGERKLSLINKRSDEGDWGEWGKELPSQFLAKQPMKLINQQINLAVADKVSEFDDICALTNPTVKKVLLKSFADDCDATAVHMKAAALPRQRYQVIMPIPSLGENEVYAPNYENGEKLALIRYPHGGTFEIPILKVNNKNKEALNTLGNDALDVVGINAKVAGRLSGADFDGDTVMVIPTGKNVDIRSTHPLKGLEDFDPKLEYPYHEGMRVMKDTQKQMGVISNLIMDMTLKGATEDELAKAVRHSMVVIDAEKHRLDYKKSEIDNDIKTLHAKYQGHIGEDGRYHEGASTLITRAGSDTQVLKRRGTPKIDKETGKLIVNEVQEEYVDKSGKTQTRMITVPKMSVTDDAFTLSSGRPQETAYANYANRMKALANQARKELVTTERIKVIPSAKDTYRDEVLSIQGKLRESAMNAPRERKAQLMANTVVKAKKQENPAMTKEEKKKAGQMALVDARLKTGAKRTPIEITDREWEAIQAGAISENQLLQILDHMDADKLRERAMPKDRVALSDAKIAKANAMRNSGYTNEEIAKALGVSESTIVRQFSGKRGEN